MFFIKALLQELRQNNRLLSRSNYLQEKNLSASQDLTAAVTALKVSADAIVAKLGTPAGDDPVVVQAVADLTAIKAELDAALTPKAA